MNGVAVDFAAGGRENRQRWRERSSFGANDTVLARENRDVVKRRSKGEETNTTSSASL